MAVNRYFDRTLMPYNPIERPMPFDQILQAGLMKQQSLDRTLAAVDEFSEQKMLMGGARTLDAAKQLNQKYIGKASDLTNQIMTGAVTPEQAGFELRNINKEYNKSNAVKQVLADQSFANLSNQASVNQRLLAKRAENPNWDYDAGSFRQESLEDLETGRATIDARGYGVMEDPGLFEDFSAELGQIHEQYIKESGVTNFYYDQNTGQYKETATNNVIEISEERVKDLINDYVYRGDISETDKQSVLYRMARRKRLDPDNPYDEEDLANDLYQAASFIPYMSTSKSQDMSASGRGGGRSGSSTTDDTPLPPTTIEIQAESAASGDIRNRVYGIDDSSPMKGIRNVISTPELKREAARSKLNVRGFDLKPGSTLDSPEFISAEGEEISKKDAAVALEEFRQFESDMHFYEGLTESVQKRFEKRTGYQIDEFVAKIFNEHGDDVEETIIDQYLAPSDVSTTAPKGSRLNSAGRERVLNSLKSSTGKDNLEIDWGNLTVRSSDIIPNFPTPESNDLLEYPYKLNPQELKEAQQKAVQDLLTYDFGLSAEDVEKYKSYKYTEKSAGVGYTPYGASVGGEIEVEHSDIIPLQALAKGTTLMSESIKQSFLDEHKEAAVMETLEKVDNATYQDYLSLDESMKKELDDNWRYKTGRLMYTAEGKEGNKRDRQTERSVRGATDLVLRRSEGSPGSGERGGETLGHDVYEKTGASPEDFKLVATYMQEGPDGTVQYYGRMSYRPKGSITKDRKAISDLVNTEGLTDFDVNITDVSDLFEGDQEVIYHASSLMKDQVYTMQANESRNTYIPGKYGPAAKVKITKHLTGLELEGVIYGEKDGKVVQMPVRDYYQEFFPGAVPRSVHLPIEHAAELASLISTTSGGVRQGHKYLYDENGSPLGSFVPQSIDDRRRHVRETLNSPDSVSGLRSAMPNLDSSISDSDITDTLEKIIEFETANTFSPSIENPDGSAIGLIQFYQDSSDNPGTKKIGNKVFKFEELARMSIEEQIQEAVIPFLKGTAGKVTDDLQQMYFAVFMPAFVGRHLDLSLEDAVRAAEADNINMDNLQPDMIKSSNPAFKDATTLRDILSGIFSK